MEESEREAVIVFDATDSLIAEKHLHLPSHRTPALNLPWHARHDGIYPTEPSPPEVLDIVQSPTIPYRPRSHLFTRPKLPWTVEFDRLQPGLRFSNLKEQSLALCSSSFQGSTAGPI